MLIAISAGTRAIREDNAPRDLALGTETRQNREAAAAIANKGHTPLLLAQALEGWSEKLSANVTDQKWEELIRKCDALFHQRDDSCEVLKFARSIGIAVFRHLDDIPSAVNALLLKPDSDIVIETRFKGIQLEYQQCADSYRHTYATLWQAGAVFALISAGILALSKTDTGDIRWVMLLCSPIPILFWYQSIFRPMDRYGRRRRDRLAEIEGKLNSLIDSLGMNHFSSLQIGKQGVFSRKNFRDFFKEPRVSQCVHVFAVIGLILWILLVGYALLPNVFEGLWQRLQTMF